MLGNFCLQYRNVTVLLFISKLLKNSFQGDESERGWCPSTTVNISANFRTVGKYSLLTFSCWNYTEFPCSHYHRQPCFIFFFTSALFFKTFFSLWTLGYDAESQVRGTSQYEIHALLRFHKTFWSQLQCKQNWCMRSVLSVLFVLIHSL